MTLPRRSFLKSIAAVLAGATAIRSAVTPAAEAVEPLPPVAEFPRKGLRIHSALLEDNLVDVQRDVMARLGREMAERMDRDCWRRLRHKTVTLPEGWNVHHTPPLRIDSTDDVTITTNLIAVPPMAHKRIHDLISVDTRDYVKLARAREHFHNIAFGLPHGTTK